MTKNTATGLANNAFSHAKTVIGGLHFANGNGPAANNGNQAAITFQGGTATQAQAGIYVHNNNSQGTHMLFATTDSYSAGPKAGITLLNNGNVTIRGTVGASNFSGSSSGTNTGDQDLSSYATSATTLAGYGITDAIQKGAQIASGASWTTATRFGSTGDLSQAAGNHALSVRSENNNDAFMSFHIGSDYAVHFGLDGASNRMHVGGWSDGTGTQYQLYDARDFSVASVLNSNVTLASLGALSTSGTAADSNLLDGKDHTQFGATLATYGTTAGSSGRIRCTAPFNTNSGHMFQIMISLYGSYTQHTYIVSAYMYSTSNQWYNPQAIYLGTGSPDIVVGRDSNGKAYISIANGNYMGVRVHNMTRGYQTSVADTYDPWTITVNAATENSVTPSIHKTWTSGNDGSGSGLDADLLDGQHASAFQAAGNYAPAGGSYGTDWYVDDLYHDAWVRNHTNNNGHYWDTSGWHLYPKDADDFYLRSGSGSCALVLTVGNETARGYVYANTSSEIGFLNNARSWSLRVDNSGNAFATASYRAPIFYDSNDTNAYFDANRLIMRGGDPTIIMRDTNHNSAMMHVNSDRWYVLRGGDDTETWTTTNGHWPLYIELGNNDAYFGRHLYALSSMRAPIFYDRDNTAYAINPASNSHFNTISCAGGFLFGDNYGVGVTGLYSASRIQTIFNMGNSYKLPNDGNSTGNAYGLYWSHPNAGTKGGANNLNDHGLLIINNGSFRAAISSRAVFSSDVRGTLFYDYNNTGYYVDPASTSNLNAATFAGDITVNGNQVITAGSNADVKFCVWDSTTYGIGMTSGVTLGGLNDYAMTFCMNNDSDRGFWWGYSGQSKNLGAMSLTTAGVLYVSNSITAAGGYLYLSSGNSIFSPSGGVIKTASNFYAERFYDYSNTGYYVDPASTSNTVNMYAVTQMRSPIYYDINNTTYYTRPSTYSYMNQIWTAGTIQAGSSGTGNIYIGNTGISGSGNHFRFHTNAGATFFDMNSGTINWRQGSSTRYYFYPSTANMTVNGTITQYSDIRYKENIVEIPDAIDKVKSIRGVYYNRTDFNTEPTKIGVIAQEVEVLMPELILRAEDTDMKSVSYNELTAVLVNAIKEQQTIIDDLKTRIETLENN